MNLNRKADRESLCSTFEKLSGEIAGCTFEKIDVPHNREILVRIEHETGLNVSFSIDTGPIVFAFCSKRKLANLDPFNNVNPYHRRKSTEVYQDFNTAWMQVSLAFERAVDGSAYQKC